MLTDPIRPPRKYLTRVLLAGLLGLALLGPAGALSLVVEDATGNHTLGGLAAWLFSAPFVVWLAPKVSYRRRDALLGPWMLGIIAWRISYLPYHDWSPRDDQVSLTQCLREAEFGAEWRPEYAGLWRLRS
ncbi:hypothetical protein [Actinoplanes regularis]|uniref:Uncharacterized protein n=1 Tax=Actinoplanes regularis TaxID=52697 RepID=A0A239FF76_9ACTN|nr:hypothetical protein [Actinoplanes regularis]SNS54953.1 hypothetical protein SAMN06264365_11830 [Actinoplanes regularis]